MNIGFLSSESHEKACPYLRLKSPLLNLHGQNALNFIHLGDLNKESVNLDLLRKLDILIVQRGMAGVLSYKSLKRVLQKSDIKIVYEIDDALTHIPDTNPHFEEILSIKPNILQYLENADMVTVSTQSLKRLYGPYNKNIAVLPNCLDLSEWGPCPNNSHKIKEENNPTTLLISGTHTHLKDFRLIEDVITQLLTEFRGKLKLIQFGGANTKVSKSPHVRVIPAVISYKGYINILKNLDVDIGLVPLEENTFNLAKSNIKWLEYSICRIPGIFSDINPYSISIENGENGSFGKKFSRILVSGHKNIDFRTGSIKKNRYSCSKSSTV